MQSTLSLRSLVHHLPNIAKLYTPLQPSTEKTQEGIRYSMTQPALPLQKYIYSYWELFTEQPLTQPYHHRVVADGCIAIIIDMLNPENNFIRGFITRYTEYLFEGSFHYSITFMVNVKWMLLPEMHD